MLPFTPTHISAVAFAFALAAHAQVCPQCPDTDNIGRPLAGNTPLVPGAGICCMSVHALRRLRWMLITVISYLTEVVSVHRTLSKTIVHALSLDSIVLPRLEKSSRDSECRGQVNPNEIMQE
ncbi:hypothetical protein B0H13DRAFT_1932802 [Mycena leptocephala]|nr:hypothetical protein B0H13DRAFT_1932802 [Mycena leptocephala]